MRLHFLLLFLLIFTFSIGRSADLTLKTEDYNNWGWQSLVIENGYIEIVIVPEIGGRVMHFAMPGDEQFAVNPLNIGKKYNPTSDQWGPWGKGYGYGGFKNWPAPQDYWSWPPPPQLDWGVYAYNIEHQSADSIVVYMQSPVEIKLAKGLQQARRITVYKNSTLVKVEQYLKNVSASVKDYAIWDITQVWVQHGSDKDYNNFSVYFPNSNSIRQLRNNIKPTEVSEGIFKFNSKKGEEKDFMTGATWCANVDERDSQSYYKLFEYDANASYSDQNSNFQIYNASDQSYIEIEVLGPLSKLQVGDSIRFDEYWSAAKVNGIQYVANRAGSITESSIGSNYKYSGVYGIFNTGSVQLHYIDKDQKELGTSAKIQVEACQQLSVSETVPAGTQDVVLYAYDSNDKLIDMLSTTVKSTVGIKDFNQKPALSVYPTICKQGEIITVNCGEELANAKVSLISLSGKVFKMDELENSENRIRIQAPAVPSGVYLLQLQNSQNRAMQKIVIQ